MAEVESACGDPPVTVEYIKRGKAKVPVTPQTVIQDDDKLLIVG